MLDLITMLKKPSLIIILCILITSCVPNPSCINEDRSCIILSETDLIHIPFILPLTGQSQNMVREQQNAIKAAFEETMGNSNIFSLEFYDNLDSVQQNTELIYTLIEIPSYPIIFSQINQQQNFLTNKTTNIENPELYPVITLPNNEQILKQAFDFLNAQLKKQSLLFSSYPAHNFAIQTEFCKNNLHFCIPYAEINFNPDSNQLISAAKTIVFVGNSIELADWFENFSFFQNKTIILLDTEFHKPVVLASDINPFWVYPDSINNTWANTENQPDYSQNEWNYLISGLIYDFCVHSFSIIELNSNDQINGFRRINQEIIYSSIKSNNPPPQQTFNIYQFDGTQFIMKNLNE